MTAGPGHYAIISGGDKMPAGVQEKLRDVFFPVRLGSQTEPAAWAGLVEVLSSALPVYMTMRQTEEQRKAAEVMADIERMRLAQPTAQANLGDFLRRYWPHLAIGVGGIVTLTLLFRKKK